VSESLTEVDEYTFAVIAQDIIDVMDHLKLEKAHFIGVSLGSIIIRKIEEKYNDRVSSIMLAGGIFDLDFKLRILSVAAKGLSHIIGHRVLYKIFARIALPKGNHKKSREIFIQESQKMEYKEFGLWINLYHELSPTLKALFKAKINAPSMVVMGSEDFLFYDTAKKYAIKFENVWFEKVANCGHVVSIEQATEFNNLCLKFLKELTEKKLEPQVIMAD
jgi:pimeloyl-ACP methyl ester carboxylesterase